MSFASASGYGSLQESPLARPYYHDRIIQKAYENDFLPMIANTAIADRLTKCYQVIQFMEEPDVGSWRKYEMNQELVPDHLTAGGFTMRICNQAYKALKFDTQDIKAVCERWNAFEESFLNSSWQGLSQMWRCYVLDGMVLETDSCNKGCSAGKYSDINLGCTGAPRNITGASFAREIAKLKRTLVERRRWVEGQMFIILPPAVQEMIVETPYANALEMGSCVNCSLLVSGQLPGRIVGFDVFHTNDVPSRMDGGAPAYYIIAGHRDAFAFAGDIIESRIVNPSNYFGTVYQMLAIWGGKMIYPDAMAIGYWAV